MCCWGLGLFPERHLASPPHCHHHTPRESSPDGWPVLDARCSAVKRWREAAGSWHPLGKPVAVPCGGGPESPSGAHGAGILFLTGAVSQAFFPALSCSPSVCLNSLLHRVRGLWSSSTGLIKERHLCSQVVVLFFSFYVCMEIVDKVKEL